MDKTDVRDEEMLDENAVSGGNDQLLGISSDLIRGHINTIILRTLYDEDKYGYDIMDEIERKSGGLYKLKAPTLYSALKRLESLGYVDSYAGEFSNGGRRKYFHLTEAGREVAKRNLSEWEFSRTIIDSLISDGDSHYDFSFIAEKQSELEELKRSLSAREAALEDEKTALSSLRNELQRERSLIATQSADLSSKRSDLGEFNENIRAQKEELAAKELALSEKQGELEAKELALQEKESELTAAKNTIECLATELNTAATQLEEYKTAAQSHADELKETESALLSLQQEYSSVRLELLTLRQNQTSNDQLDQIEALQTQLKEKEEKLSAAEKALEEKLSELEKRETALVSSQLELSEKTAQYYELLSKVTADQARLETERTDLETAKHAAAENSEEWNALQAEFQTIKALLEDKNTEIENLQGLISSREDALQFLRDELEKKNDAISVESDKAIQLEETLKEQSQQLESLRQTLEEQLNEQTKALQEERLLFETDRESWAAEKAALSEKLAALDQQKRQLEDETAALEIREAEIARKEYELNERQISFGHDQSRTTADKELFEKERQELAEKQEQVKRLGEQLRYEQELMKQQQAELTTRLELFNQQQLDYLARKQALTLQQFENEDKYVAHLAQAKHLNDSMMAFEAEKNAFASQKEAFEEEKKAFETEKAQFREEKRRTTESNRVFVDSLTAKEDAFRREEARLQALNAELERRATELNTARGPAPTGYVHPTPSAIPPAYDAAYAAGTPAGMDELYRRAERDGIRLNSRTAPSTRYPVSAQPRKETKPAPTFNKGATLFKAALLTFCFLAVECIIVFFMKDSLNVPFFYPLIPLAIGLVAFAICSILYASGYQPNARLNKKSATYIFSAVILFVVGIIIASMIAVYCRAPLATPTTLLAFIVIPAVFLTNIVLYPIFYHFFAIANENKETEE